MANIIAADVTLGAQSLFVADDPSVLRRQVWWDRKWPFRRDLTITTEDRGDIPEGHPLTVYLSYDLITKGKVRDDLRDIEVLYLSSLVPETWVILRKEAEIVDNQIRVRWDAEAEIEAGNVVEDTYYIYYGNSSLSGKPKVATYSYVDYPISISYIDQQVMFSGSVGDWIDGASEVPLVRATVPVRAEQIQIYANTGPANGIAEVQVDDGAWESVDLFSNETLNSQMVWETTDLSDARHTIRYRVSGRANPAATGRSVNLNMIKYKKHGIVEDVREEVDESLMWSSVIGGTV